MGDSPEGGVNRYAAVDLGSNSFHLLIARRDDGRLTTIDSKKDMVRLAAGLDADRNLSAEKQEEALEALARMGQLLRGIPPANKRAVGTNTLRAARGADEFLERASQALGCPIDVIAGHEEARLIYIGVSHSLEPISGNQLVVDIGGGSTECIIGRGFEPELCHSLRMGCVSYTQGFFRGGAIKEDTLSAAIFAASNEVSSLQQEFLAAGFEAAFGSSGTIGAIRQTLLEQGWTQGPITAEALAKLRRQIVKAGHVDKIRLPGISERRREVLPGGVAILSAIFERLRVESMSYSEGALRDGVLYDLMGRAAEQDVRDRSVAAMQRRYGVSLAQAARVARRLAHFIDQVGQDWELDGEQWRRMGRWAAALHEVGLAISYPGHHKHGAYLIEHSDLSGFARGEQQLLAALVLCHRRKFRHDVVSQLARVSAKQAMRLAVLLRLAVRVERLRVDQQSPDVTLKVDGKKLEVCVHAQQSDYSLLASDLATEAEQLARTKFELRLRPPGA